MILVFINFHCPSNYVLFRKVRYNLILVIILNITAEIILYTESYYTITISYIGMKSEN